MRSEGCQAWMSGKRSLRLRLQSCVVLVIGVLTCSASGAPTARVTPKTFLNMPESVAGALPPLLSQTGAFANVRTLTPAPGLIPYDLVVPFWSDAAAKLRFIAIPAGKIAFSPSGEWRFPPGTVFVKTFELPVDAGNPGAKRRLETRLLVYAADSRVYGVVYKWRADGSDADLLQSSLTENIPIRAANGSSHAQTWYYPSRKDCLVCHNAKAGAVLGVKTRQLNKTFEYPSGPKNQLLAWNDLQLFAPSLQGMDLAKLPTLAAADDESRSLEDRARSYLDANCSQCHRPGGTVAYFDARYVTPPDHQSIVEGPVLIDEGIDHPRVVAAHDIWRSIAYMRVNTVGDIGMPPLARETIDAGGVALLRAWIESMPGRPVLAPPKIAPAGGDFPSAIDVALTAADKEAEIHYTLDGSEPGRQDPVYTKPIHISDSSVLRARAYKDGYTRSIATQSVFILGN